VKDVPKKRGTAKEVLHESPFENAEKGKAYWGHIGGREGGRGEGKQFESNRVQLQKRKKGGSSRPVREGIRGARDTPEMAEPRKMKISECCGMLWEYILSDIYAVIPGKLPKS